MCYTQIWPHFECWDRHTIHMCVQCVLTLNAGTGRGVPLCVTAASAMELQLGVFGFLTTTHAETKANKMRAQPLRAVQHFTPVYFHAQAAVHTSLLNCGYFDHGKNLNTPN